MESDLYEFPFCPEESLIFSRLIQTLDDYDLEGADVLKLMRENFADKEGDEIVTRSESAGALVKYGFPEYVGSYDLVREHEFSDEPGFIGNLFENQIRDMVSLGVYEQGLGPPIFGIDDPTYNIHWVIWLYKLHVAENAFVCATDDDCAEGFVCSDSKVCQPES